jgi:hypothetical protein
MTLPLADLQRCPKSRCCPHEVGIDGLTWPPADHLPCSSMTYTYGALAPLLPFEMQWES